MNKNKAFNPGFINKIQKYCDRYAIKLSTVICIFLLVGAGIILCLCSKEKNVLPKNTVNTKTDNNVRQDENLSCNTQFEKEICDILSEINGVGKVKIMISYSNLYSKNGCSPYLSDRYGAYNNENTNSGGDVKGAVVVAEGAGDAQVKSDIVYAVSALLDVPVCNIKVYENKADEVK